MPPKKTKKSLPMELISEIFKYSNNLTIIEKIKEKINSEEDKIKFCGHVIILLCKSKIVYTSSKQFYKLLLKIVKDLVVESRDRAMEIFERPIFLLNTEIAETDSGVNGENNEEAEGTVREDNGIKENQSQVNTSEEHSNEQQNADEEPYHFSIDFQNQGCSRDNCRYVHAFREDVERTGEVTDGLTRSRSLAALMRGDMINTIPLCERFKRFMVHDRHIGTASPFGTYTGHAAGRLDEGSSSDVPPEERATTLPLSSPMTPSGPTRSQDGLERRHNQLLLQVDRLKCELVYEKERQNAFPGTSQQQPPTIFNYDPLPVQPLAAPMMTSGPTRSVLFWYRAIEALLAEVHSLKRELERERKRYDLMSLCRGSRANQTPEIQQSVPSVASNQPGISSISAQQQQEKEKQDDEKIEKEEQKQDEEEKKNKK